MQAYVSAWIPSFDALYVHPAELNLRPSRLQTHDVCMPEDSKPGPCLMVDQAKLAEIRTWLPASNTSAASGEANLDGVDSGTASMLSSLAAWLPQTPHASSSAPETQRPRTTTKTALPKCLAPLPPPQPPLPGQCDVVEVDQFVSPRCQHEQALPVQAPVRASAGLTSTAAVAFETSGIRAGEGVSSHEVRIAGYIGQGVSAASRVAVGRGMQPLPKLTTKQRSSD